MLDSTSAVPAPASSVKRSRSEFEEGDESARPNGNGPGHMDVEGMQWSHVIECLTNLSYRLLI